MGLSGGENCTIVEGCFEIWAGFVSCGRIYGDVSNCWEYGDVSIVRECEDLKTLIIRRRHVPGGR